MCNLSCFAAVVPLDRCRPFSWLTGGIDEIPHLSEELVLRFGEVPWFALQHQCCRGVGTQQDRDDDRRKEGG